MPTSAHRTSDHTGPQQEFLGTDAVSGNPVLVITNPDMSDTDQLAKRIEAFLSDGGHPASTEENTPQAGTPDASVATAGHATTVLRQYSYHELPFCAPSRHMMGTQRSIWPRMFVGAMILGLIWAVLIL